MRKVWRQQEIHSNNQKDSDSKFKNEIAIEPVTSISPLRRWSVRATKKKGGILDCL